MELKPGYKQTEVGVIPEDWEVDQLGSIAILERGKFSARPRNDPKFFGGEIPFIQTGDVTNSDGQIKTYAQTLNDAGLKVSRLFPRDTLFFTIAANIGDVGIADFETACTDSLIAITPGKRTSKSWLFHTLKSRKKVFEGLATQNAQLNINLEKLRPFSLAIPPIPEQRAIATALSEVDGLIRAQEQLIAKKRDLKQAAMQQLLTAQHRLPGFSGEWTKRKIGELATLHRENVIPMNSSKEFFTHFSLPAFDTSRTPVIEAGASILSNKFRVPQNAVLVSKLNPRIPRVWAPSRIPDNAVASTEFLIFVPKELVTRNFLYSICTSSYFCGQMELAATGTTGSHQRMNPMDALSIEVQIPESKAEQTAIAEVLSEQDEELAKLEARLAKTRALKQGMMQSLLTGRIRLV